MSTLPPSPNFLRRAVLPLAVVVFVLAFAGKASAGCGDHVVILKSGGESNADEPTPTKPPCHGPHCSAGPAAPTPPPVTSGVLPLSTAKELFTPISVDPPTAPPVGFTFEFASPRPIDRASSIFHPPRG